MNRIFFIGILFSLIYACGAPATEETYPQDLEGKRVLLKEKQGELKAISEVIKQLESEIEALDSTVTDKSFAVTTQPLTKTTFVHYTEVQGSIEADDLVAIASETGGRILELRIKEGQNITKGQLVAKLDLESVEKQIAELETQLELANDLYARQQRLWEQKIGSEVQYLQAKNNKERLEKGLETIKLQLSKSSVYAPISGVVEMLNTKTGEIAAPGAPIAMILNTSKVKIVADVPETLIRAIRKGEKVQATIPALDWENTVTVTEIARSIDKNNRTLQVEAEITNSNGLVKPNLLATMQIKDYEQKDAIVVPIELVQQEIGGADFVFVVETNGSGRIAKKVYVETGRTYKNNVVVEKGLQGNEELVVKGAQTLVDNALIEVVQ